MRIILVGYMGSGKTGTGKELSALTGYNFIDTDELFEERYRISIFDFFEKYGEESFRKMERDILLEVLGLEDVIIATGGGTPCFFDNMERIIRAGITLYLKLQPDFLVERLSKVRKKRPLLRNKSDGDLESFIRRQLKERENIYSRAHYTVDQDNEAVVTILRIMHESRESFQ